jgi:hypothetical protein
MVYINLSDHLTYCKIEITLPVAIVAAAYIIGQGLVDAFGD